MKWFNNCKTLQDVKKLYKELAKLHHPDRGGNTATMQEINNEYEYAIRKAAKGENLSAEETEAEIKLSAAYKEAIQKIAHLEGLKIELVGKWIWVTGNTFLHKDVLRAAQFLFAPVKKAWYFRTEEYKVNNHGVKLSLDAIRRKYGSQTIDGMPANTFHFLAR